MCRKSPVRQVETGIDGVSYLSAPLQEQIQSVDSSVSGEEVAFALHRILESPEFAQSARMSDFLRFVVEQTQQGAGSQLKQTVIGVTVFGREPGYDPSVDPVVRVEARRLRAKLQEYYSGSGAADAIRIELPKGTYQPQFRHAAATPGLSVSAPARAVSSRAAIAAGIAVVVVALAGGLIFYWRPPPETAAPPRLLTDRQMYARSPRFAPDGSRIVFSREPGPDTSHIVVAPASGGEPVPLTSGAVLDYEPAWSPDGRRIAFLRQTGALTYAIFLRDSTSAIGSEQMLVAGIRDRGALAFSRDGQMLIFADRPDQGAPAAIYSVALDSRATKRVSSPPRGIAGDAHPQISPDGSSLAFLRMTESGVGDIFEQRLGGGEARQVSREQGSFQGIGWTADGRAILGSIARRDEAGSLWRFPVNGGEPLRVAEAGIRPLNPAVSAVGNRLAFVARIADTNLWRADLPADDSAAKPRALTSSAVLDTSPQLSPDGSRIVWRSAASGTDEIWMASALDGSGARRLTSMRGPVTGSPRWSPDGKQVVFESRRDGRGRLFLISDAGGSARPLMEGAFNDILPSWSRDGRQIYFASDRSGQWQVWRMTEDGGGAQQITRSGGFAAFESWDGKTLYYSRQAGGIWKTPRDGGPETLVTSELAPNFWGQFAVAERSLFYLVFSPNARAIRRIDLSTGQIRDVLPLTRLPVGWDSGMAVSRDGSAIVWSQLDAGASDIYIVDGFR